MKGGQPAHMQEGQKNEIFHFEPLKEDDLSLLYDWLNRPHIAEHWDGAISLRETRKKYMSAARCQTVSFYIAWLAGQPTGFVQSYLADKLENHVWPSQCADGTVGIDYFLADPQQLGKGLGSKMVAQFCQMLFANPATTKIICDPAPDNALSIGCLKNVGFLPLALIETPDGQAIAMELLRGKS
jgi:aminoglycoside 6'-N-acetyltransferase-1b